MTLEQLAAALERPGCSMDLARIAAEVIREYAGLIEEGGSDDGEEK